MCPVFRATRGEEATPRAKANLLQTILAAGGDPRRLSADDVRDVAELCVNCKMCATECPAHVNIPKLMLEAKAANVAEHGLDRTDWVLARTESFARVVFVWREPTLEQMQAMVAVEHPTVVIEQRVERYLTLPLAR